MKKGNQRKSWRERKQDYTVKVITLDSLAGGRFRCNQTGKLLRRSQILSEMMEVINNQKTTIVRPGQANPPKAKRR